LLGHGEWDEDLKNIFEVYINNHGAFLIAEHDDKIIGMGALKRVSDQIAEVKRMRVSPEHQGRGLGTKLLKFIEKKAEELGYKELILDTSDRQKAAIHIYKKHGYKEYKRGFLGGWEAIYMKKTI
jgi:ribosomal protein S18 acetylase RimI-like enzyme